FAERLLQALGSAFDLDGAREHVTCSVGIALAPDHAVDADVLMRHADLALYAAKESGRSTYRFYEAEMRLAAERRHVMTAELWEALEKRQFELHYQPIVQLDDDGIAGFEALIRWRHPRRGLVAPMDFIPLAEETGLIVPIGDWVIREACRTAAGWPEHLRIAVNLSVSQFRHASLLSTVVGALDQTGLNADRLEIEITESVFLTDVDQSLPLLRALKELGVRIAIDDFGTGYSSLSYLRSFPFDKIKLDRSFVSGIETDAGNLAIVRAVVGIGSGFNATTLAEGIETEEQLQKLRAEGFSEVQGYLLGRPMPREKAEALIYGGAPKAASSYK
ncbi:GGDEF domain-containing phosphodiesterase, partial [Rhizobium sp. Pop5]